MFITSRESAITVSLLPTSQPGLLFPVPLRKLREPSPRSNRDRVYFGVLSISQPEARASPREFPGFVGFYGVFLELTKSGLAVEVYILCIRRQVLLQAVAIMQIDPQSPQWA